MSYIEQTRKEIIEAYVFLRTNNMTIPSETLEFMKDSSLEALDQALTLTDVVFSEAELKAKLEEQLEETRQWLIGDFLEGHDLGTVLDKMYDQRFNVGN